MTNIPKSFLHKAFAPENTQQNPGEALQATAECSEGQGFCDVELWENDHHEEMRTMGYNIL